MNELLCNLFRSIRSDPKMEEQTSEVVVRLEQLEPDTLGLGFDEFVIQLEDDGTWHVVTRLGV